MTATERCPRCRRPAPTGAAFCASCGAALGDAPGDPVTLDFDAGRDVGAVHEVVLAPDRRRGRIGVAVAVALAVAVGASIAVGGSGDDTAAPASTTARARVATTAARTTAPPAPSTTTSIVAVAGPTAPPLLGEPTGIRLLVVTQVGLVLVDLDTARAGVLRPAELTFYADDLAPVRGGFVSSVDGELRVFTEDGRTVADPGRPGELLGVDAAGHAYAIEYPMSDGEQARLVVFDDAVSGRREVEGVPISFDRYPPVRPDGDGGFVVPVAGGVLRWTRGDTALVPVAPGDLVDAAGRAVLTRLCFPELVCRLTVTDLATGEAREIPATAIGPDGGRLSPDGRWIVRRPDFDRFTGEVDLAAPLRLTSTIDERVVELPAGTGGGLAWSTDGRWLFYAGTRPSVLLAWRDGLAAPLELTFADLDLRGAVAAAWSP